MTETDPFLSVVIPAYNEGRKIYADLDNVCRYFNGVDYPYEVIVVDDGSTDETSDTVRLVQQRAHAVKLVAYLPNRGKGYAVKTGVLQASGRNILFADAGNCVPYEEVEKGLRLLQGGYDIAIGSRGLEDSMVLVKQPQYRQVGSRIFQLIVRYGLGLGDIHDTQCGFKLFKREVAQVLFKEQRTEGFMFDIEILLNARQRGYSIIEFPLAWSNDPDTRFKPVMGSVRNLTDLLRIKWNGRNPHHKG